MRLHFKKITFFSLVFFNLISNSKANNHYLFANDANLNYYSQASNDSNLILVSSDSIDFGLVHVYFSDSALLEITNIGEIEIKSIVLELKSPFFVKCDSFSNIFPDSILKLNIYFSPFEMIQYLDTLKIIYVDAVSMNLDTLSIFLKGNGADARIKYYSNSYSFGDVHIRDKKEFSVPIENMGNIPLLIKGVTTQNNSFSIIAPIVDQIKSGSIDFLKFEFSPDKINKDSTIVDINYTDPLLQNIKPDSVVKNSKLILYGVGKESILQILDFENLTEMKNLNFNECYIDSMESKKIVFRNIGNLDLILVLPPIQISDFKLVFPKGQIFPLLILKNDTIHANIEFHPSKAGVISDTTVFPYNDIFNSKIYYNTAVLNLNGKGIARGPIIFDVSSSIPILYQDCSVQAKINAPNSKIVEDSIHIWIRKGGEINFSSLNFIEKINPNTYILKFRTH